MSGWYGVDLDSSLARYAGWGDGSIGEPIQPMLDRVRAWLGRGHEVRVVTARAGDPGELAKVRAWLDDLNLQDVAITDRKDFAMIELWDDRAVQVIANTGQRADGQP